MVTMMVEQKEENQGRSRFVGRGLRSGVAAVEVVAKDLCSWEAEAVWEVHRDRAGSPVLDRGEMEQVRGKTMLVMVAEAEEAHGVLALAAVAEVLTELVEGSKRLTVVERATSSET